MSQAPRRIFWQLKTMKFSPPAGATGSRFDALRVHSGEADGRLARCRASYRAVCPDVTTGLLTTVSSSETHALGFT